MRGIDPPAGLARRAATGGASDEIGGIVGIGARGARAAGGSAYIFGHSSGAVLALMAAGHGLPISKLAVYEPPYIVEGTRPRPMNLTARTRELIEAGLSVNVLVHVLEPSVEVAHERTGGPAECALGGRTSTFGSAAGATRHVVVHRSVALRRARVSPIG